MPFRETVVHHNKNVNVLATSLHQKFSLVESQPQSAAGFLLSAVPAGDIEPSSSGAAARRSAANASSVTLTTDVGSRTQTCCLL